MGIIQDLCAQHAPELIEQVGEAVGGIDRGQLEALLPPTGQQLEQAVSSGSLDLSALLGGGGVGELLSKLDVGSIASSSGVDTQTAQQGLAALVPAIGALLQREAGGAGELLAKLGGKAGAKDLLGAAGKLAGGLFGKD